MTKKTKFDSRQLIFRSFKIKKKKVLTGSLGQTLIEGEDDMIDNKGTLVIPNSIEKTISPKLPEFKNKKIKKIQKINKIKAVKNRKESTTN